MASFCLCLPFSILSPWKQLCFWQYSAAGRAEIQCVPAKVCAGACTGHRGLNTGDEGDGIISCHGFQNLEAAALLLDPCSGTADSGGCSCSVLRWKSGLLHTGAKVEIAGPSCGSTAFLLLPRASRLGRQRGKEQGQGRMMPRSLREPQASLRSVWRCSRARCHAKHHSVLTDPLQASSLLAVLHDKKNTLVSTARRTCHPQTRPQQSALQGSCWRREQGMGMPQAAVTCRGSYLALPLIFSFQLKLCAMLTNEKCHHCSTDRCINPLNHEFMM